MNQPTRGEYLFVFATTSGVIFNQKIGPYAFIVYNDYMSYTITRTFAGARTWT